MRFERLLRSKELGNHISGDLPTQTAKASADLSLSHRAIQLSRQTFLPTLLPKYIQLCKEMASHLDLQLDSQTSSLLMERQKRIFLTQHEAIQISSHPGCHLGKRRGSWEPLVT